MPDASGVPTAPAGASVEAASPGLRLCASAELVERGPAVGFDVRLWGKPARAFAMRFDGALVAYINRCVHVPVEMDWQPGQFLDMDKRWIICSIHGATYEPKDGHCVGGPCGRGKLRPVRTDERDGQVYWYPSSDIEPAALDAPAAPESPAP